MKHLKIILTDDEFAQLKTSLKADLECFEDEVKHHKEDREVKKLLVMTRSILKKIGA